MPHTTLGELLKNKYANPEETQNESPTIKELYEFGNSCMQPGITIEYEGYAISLERADYRVSIDGINVTAIEGEIDIEIIINFVKLSSNADEFRITKKEMRLWWD